MIRQILLVLVFTAFSIAVFQSCHSDSIPETAFEPSKDLTFNQEELLTIHLAVNETYCKKTACICVHEVAAREYELLQEELKKQFNIDLQLTYFVETFNMEDELAKKTFDGVICKPWTAYMLADENNINYKRIADVLDPYNSPWLMGIFVVKVDSPVKSLADITGLTLVTGQKDSYEKYHLPMYMLEENGVEPKKIYGKSSCLECINELLDGRAEVAVVSDYTFSASCAVDVANPDEFKTIAETERIPLTSVILDMDKVSETDALRLQKALLALSGSKSPEGMLGKGFAKPVSWKPLPFKETK